MFSPKVWSKEAKHTRPLPRHCTMAHAPRNLPVTGRSLLMDMPLWAQPPCHSSSQSLRHASLKTVVLQVCRIDPNTSLLTGAHSHTRKSRIGNPRQRRRPAQPRHRRTSRVACAFLLAASWQLLLRLRHAVRMRTRPQGPGVGLGAGSSMVGGQVLVLEREALLLHVVLQQATARSGGANTLLGVPGPEPNSRLTATSSPHQSILTIASSSPAETCALAP